MADYQSNIGRFEAVGAAVVALSVDSWDDARRTVEEHGLTFPVLYGLDVKRTVASLGCYANERADPPHLHATSFVLRPNGKVALALYSSGALGRLSVEDAATLVEGLSRRGE